MTDAGRWIARAGRGGACGILVLLLAACESGEVVPEARVPGPRAIALVGGRVHPAPEADAIADGVVVIERGVTTAVGPRARVHIPAGATVLDCTGATVTAGFWNAHVHFTEPAWADAGTADPARLAHALQAMLTRWGFVRVVDTGTPPDVNVPLRRRIESGEVPGPAILIAGGGIVPDGGSPFYVRPLRLFEARTAEDAATRVEAVAALGADALKLFTGSYAEPNRIVVMPVEVVRGAVTAAHRRGLLVIAHPSNSAGARAALEGGVDILAHVFPADADGPWDRTLPPRMAERRMALIPTLTLFSWELTRLGLPAPLVQRLLANGEAQVRAFAEAGGQLLFGTDVGYMTVYDPTDEYVRLHRAGLSYPRILAMLTTAPAERFGLASRTGRLAPGFDADITVIEGDPAQDIRALARVRYALRTGRLLYGTPS
jgi:imidazolonepropionase-like amidohydrolase